MEGLGYGERSLYAQSVRRALVRVDDPAWTSPTRRCPTRRRRSRLARAAKDERWRARGSSKYEVAGSATPDRGQSERGICNFQLLPSALPTHIGEHGGGRTRVSRVWCVRGCPPPLLPTTFRFLPRAARAVTRRGAVRLRCSVERGSVTPTRTRERGAGERAGPRALYWARWARSFLCDVCEVSRV